MKTSWPKATMMVGSKFLKVYLRYINILTLHYGEVLMGGSGSYSNLQKIAGKYHFHLHWSYFDFLSMKNWKLEMLTFYKSVCWQVVVGQQRLWERQWQRQCLRKWPGKYCLLVLLSIHALQEEKRKGGKIKSCITRSRRLKIFFIIFILLIYSKIFLIKWSNQYVLIIWKIRPQIGMIFLIFTNRGCSPPPLTVPTHMPRKFSCVQIIQ